MARRSLMGGSMAMLTSLLLAQAVDHARCIKTPLHGQEPT